MLARRLFLLDLDLLPQVINGLISTVGAEAAAEIFEAIATCTTYEGEQWIAAETAAELAAQVELRANMAEAGSVGRLLYLRTKERMRPLYIQRANRNSTWPSSPLQCSPFSHEVDETTGLPKDLEYAMRNEIIKRFPQVTEAQELAGPILDETERVSWATRSPTWLRLLRKARVIALLPPGIPLDERFVDRLVHDYPLVLVAVDPGNPPALSDRADWQMLDPDVAEELADQAFMAYDLLRASLAGARNGN